MDTAFYYLRKKKKQYPEEIGQKFTTTDSNFCKYIQEGWETFQKSGEQYDWGQLGTCRDYVIGGHIKCNTPWVDVDFVYIPMQIGLMEHWILLLLDVCERSVALYDSLSGSAAHDAEVDEACAGIVNFLPHVLNNLGVFDGKPDAEKGNKPFLIHRCLHNPKQDNG